MQPRNGKFVNYRLFLNNLPYIVYTVSKDNLNTVKLANLQHFSTTAPQTANLTTQHNKTTHKNNDKVEQSTSQDGIKVSLCRGGECYGCRRIWTQQSNFQIAKQFGENLMSSHK